MKRITILLLLILAFTISPALAAPWDGITPTVTTIDELVKRFGEPVPLQAKDKQVLMFRYNKANVLMGDAFLVYCFKDSHTADAILIYPAGGLNAAAVRKQYGGNFKTVISQVDFRPFDLDDKNGVAVFYQLDTSTVETILFFNPNSPKKPDLAVVL